MTARKEVLFTGFPGFIGSKLVERLLELHPEARFHLFVEERQLAEARRASRGLAERFGEGVEERLKLIAGDISLDHLGLSHSSYRRLCQTVTHVWHVAGLYDLAAPAERAFRVNTLGTQNVLDLCEASPGLVRLDQVSTCLVSGDRTGLVLESELDEGQRFHNAYEASKFRAEQEVLLRRPRVPATIHRPSMVLGDSRTGETSKRDGLYFLIDLLLRAPRWLPPVHVGRSGAALNVVPVDFVVEAMARLWTMDKAVGQTIHLVDPSPLSAREIVERLTELTGFTKPVADVPPEMFEGVLSLPLAQRALTIPKETVVYFNHDVRYDATNQLRLLEDSDLRCPDLREVLPVLVDFARRQRSAPSEVGRAPEAAARERWALSWPRRLRRQLGAQAGVAQHIARRTADGAGDPAQTLPARIKRATSDVVLLETAVRRFSSISLFEFEDAFLPHLFLPNFHGPFYDESVRRLVLPGQGPAVVYFSITGRCPCSCKYCFAGADERGTFDALDDDKLLEVTRKLAEASVPVVNFSGGEPLVRYPQLLEATRILSARSEVRLFTCGIGLTEARLRSLIDAGLSGIFVSLDTEDAEHHDRVRGRPGAFRAATEALALSASMGLPTFINCVVGPERFHRREEIVRFFRFVDEIDPRIIVSFLPRMAVGRGLEDKSFRTPEECSEVAERILQTGRAIRRPMGMLFGRVDDFLGCPGAGGKLMNIDTHGNVTVCISKASLGNLIEEPFETVYQRYCSSCDRLKVGFFCCEVSKVSGSERVLAPKESLAQLQRFYGETEDSGWQQNLDRYGGLFTWLIGE